MEKDSVCGCFFLVVKKTVNFPNQSKFENIEWENAVFLYMLRIKNIREISSMLLLWLTSFHGIYCVWCKIRFLWINLFTESAWTR